VRAALEETSRRKAGTDFGLGMNPEFLREGSAVCDFLDPDRIVLGGSDPRSTAAIAELYASFSCPKLAVAPVNAELIKYASNALLSTLVSFSNEWAAVCEGLPGADVQTLMRTYAHVIRADDDRVRAVVDDHFGVSAEDFLRTDTPRGVPFIGPDLRRCAGFTSTPRSAGCPWSCGGRG